jgi:dipeptidyl aminopeptidase/acylaminoacyl peptidase
VQVTHGAEGESSPAWAPDGKTIAFIARRGGETAIPQIYLLPANGGEARQLTTHPTAVSAISWTPDGKALLFRAADARTPAETAKDRTRDDVYAYDENYKHMHLWKAMVESRTATRVTHGEFSVVAYQLSEDGSKIVDQRVPSPLLADVSLGDIWVAKADGSDAARMTNNRIVEAAAALSPDNSEVLFISGANEKLEPYYNGRLFVTSESGKIRAVVSEKESLAVDYAVWSKDGKSIYFLVNMGSHEQLFVVPAGGGTPKQLTKGNHDVLGMSQSGSHLAFVLGSSSGSDIYTLKEGEHELTRVTRFSQQLTRDFSLGRQESIVWKAADGAAVEGILTYPVGYVSGQRYPLIVMTHGGPQASDKYSIGGTNYPVQVFAGKGYLVLQPNHRGSTGYGDPFLRDMIGHYFQNSHLDVMAGADEVIRRGMADPDRLIKMGWSAGGHMTNKIITFSDRFKAASSGAGVAQWVSMYGQSDMRSNRDHWFGGTPWQKNAPIDVYWNNSPLKDVANVRTPTIFFVGERDPRVPMPQSLEMHRALKSNGVPTHLYVGPREVHVWTEPKHLLFKINAEIEWFERHAMGRPYTWEKAPGDEKSESTGSGGGGAARN